MKNRINFLLIVAFILVTVSSSMAQSYKLEISHVNPALRGTSSLDTSTTYINGLRVGVTGEWKIKKQLSLLSGALYNVVYSNKLQKYRELKSVNYLITGQSVDIPLRLTYTVQLAKNLKMFAFGGPNLNVGLSATRGIVSTLDSAQIKFTGITSQVQNLYKPSILSRLNLQVGVGGGVQWKKYILKSGYDFGLLNMNLANDKKLYQSGWYVTIGYEL